MNFVDGIKKILDISLPNQEGTLGDIINSYVKNILENKKSIMEGNVPAEPVRSVIALICSNGGRWAPLGAKARKQLEGRNPIDLLNERELNSFLNNVYKKHGKAYKASKEKISQFLKAVKDLDEKLKRWPKSERLKRFKREMEKILKTKAHIGRKGRDDILRDCGFLNHVPIDVHERRFLLRTGIFHKYASLTESDPTDYGDLAEAMKLFCKEELKGIEINGIPLSDAPGIVDLIIWYFSQERTEQKRSLGICAKRPQCKKCPLQSLCLFAKLNAKELYTS